MIVRLTRSAGKHGIVREEIRLVLAAPLCTVEQGDTVLHIGLTSRRDLLEVVVAPGAETLVLHAMRLRPANYHHLDGLSAVRSSSPTPPPGSAPPCACTWLGTTGNVLVTGIP
jgi:hypothetical protein